MNRIIYYISGFSPSFSLFIATLISLFASREIIKVIFKDFNSPFTALFLSTIVLIFIWILPVYLGALILEEDDEEKIFSKINIIPSLMGVGIFLSLFPWNSISSEIIGFINGYFKEIILWIVVGITFSLIFILISHPFTKKNQDVIYEAGFISILGAFLIGKLLKGILKIEDTERILEVFFVLLLFLFFLIIFGGLIFLVALSYAILLTLFLSALRMNRKEQKHAHR